MVIPASKPTPLVRAALVCVVLLLPWFAVFSGTYRMYCFVVLALSFLAPWLLIPLLVLAAPHAVLLQG